MKLLVFLFVCLALGTPPVPAGGGVKPSSSKAKKTSPPSAKSLRGKTLTFDFSQCTITPDKGCTKDKPQILNSKVYISRLLREPYFDHCYYARLGKRTFLRSEPGKKGTFPKSSSWITYDEKGGKLSLASDDIPDKYGCTNDCYSFYLEVDLSFIDANHATACGVIEIIYRTRYTGTIKNIHITLTE